MPRTYKQVTITLPPAIFDEIERRRGLIPRSRYIGLLVEKALRIEPPSKGG